MAATPNDDVTTALVPVHAAVLDRPFSLNRRLLDLDAGLSVAELLAHAGIPPGTPTRVYLNGDLVYPEYYHVVRPKRGAHVLVRVVPRGGGGGGKGVNIGMLIVGVILEIAATILLMVPGVGAGLAPPLIFAGAGLIQSGQMHLVIPPAPGAAG